MNSSSADILAFNTCCDAMTADSEQTAFGGLSYDYTKAFDLVPTQLAVNILRLRGCDEKVTRSLDGFYRQHVTYFQLNNHYDKVFEPTNGLIQGCALSILILASLIKCWHEHLDCHHPTIKARSYVDDLSICAASPSPESLRRELQSAHTDTTTFATRAGLQINANKSFSFGHKALKGGLPGLQIHKRTFRLTGGCVKLDPTHEWTSLEQERSSKWLTTISNIRKLPIGWLTKTKLMQRAMPQFSWGQGNHQLAASTDTIRKLRAAAVRCLLNVDYYSAAPRVIFAALCPPSIDPEMSLQVSALNLFKRALNTPAKALLMTRAIAECDEKANGPVGRARQLLKSPVYGPCMQSILDHKSLPPTWQHDLRQRFRLATWQSLVSDRPQDFSGAFAGIQEKLSTSLLQWSAEADELQFLLDSNLVSEPPTTQDPRPRLKILRLLICGGLMDPERDARHRKKPGTVYCKCNQPINFDHITWQCPLTADLRAPAIAVLSDTVESLPLCFRRTTLVPQTFQIDKSSLHIVQTSLVNIWQKHILDWCETEEPATFAPPVTDNAESNLRQPVERNGHIIKPIPNAEGVFCVRCGMQTKLVKHLRLKILRKKCTQANVSSDIVAQQTWPSYIKKSPR